MRSLYVIRSFISLRKTQANNRELLRLRMFEFFISYVTKGCFARNDVYRRFHVPTRQMLCWLLPVSIVRIRGDFLFISQFQTRSLN